MKERDPQPALIAVVIVRLRKVHVGETGRIQSGGLRRGGGPLQVAPVLDLVAMHENAAVEGPPAKERRSAEPPRRADFEAVVGEAPRVRIADVGIYAIEQRALGGVD